jgi:toxin secretion/phage lysis holin
MFSLFGVIGGTISSLIGGWDFAVQTLVIFMIADYITGIIVAGIFKNSKKSENGTLESVAGWKGLCRKGGTLLIVLIAFRLDIMLGSSFIRDAVVIGYIANESLSIIENLGLMGIPIPEQLKNGINALMSKGGKQE